MAITMSNDLIVFEAEGFGLPCTAWAGSGLVLAVTGRDISHKTHTSAGHNLLRHAQASAVG
jgi:hypothetical protein